MRLAWLLTAHRTGGGADGSREGRSGCDGENSQRSHSGNSGSCENLFHTASLCTAAARVKRPRVHAGLHGCGHGLSMRLAVRFWFAA